MTTMLYGCRGRRAGRQMPAAHLHSSCRARSISAGDRRTSRSVRAAINNAGREMEKPKRASTASIANYGGHRSDISARAMIRV